MKLRFGIVSMAIVLAYFCTDQASSSPSSPSEHWHVPTVPQVISKEIQFANGDAHLVGTVYLPKNGNHLPGVVVLHHAGIATGEAEL